MTCRSEMKTFEFPTQAELVLSRLRLSPGAWFEAPELASVSHSLALHSVVAVLRRRGHAIENRTSRRGRQCLSFYRILPSTNAAAGAVTPAPNTNGKVDSKG